MAYYYNANDKYHEISDQYKGYNFGNTEIYNPVSIINYFSKTTLWSSWGNLVNHKMLERILFDLMNSAKKEAIYNLLDGNSLETIFDFNNLSPTPQNKVFDIWFYLLSTGYLTARNGKLLSDGQWICYLVIPNKEVSRIYFSTIRDIMDNEVSFIEEFC